MIVGVHIMRLLSWIVFAAFAAVMPSLATAKIEKIPADFRTQAIRINGATIHVRVGDKGPAVVMLLGFGNTGDMWAPVAKALAKDHTVIVPDLRGMGLSSHPDGGDDKKTPAKDIAAVMESLKADKADLVTHDIGNMVGYALAA
jgi:pimeloyl-ACP methyl ester carboxylesterase